MPPFDRLSPRQPTQGEQQVPWDNNGRPVGALVADGSYTDITVSGSGTSWQINAGVVTNAKLANMAQATIKGRAAGAGTGPPVDLSGAQVKTILALTAADVGLGSVDNTADATKNVLSATKLTTARNIAMTGDVAWNVNFDGSGNVTAAGTISNGAVTLAKQANMATASVVYRKTAGSGAPEVQTLATLKTDLGLTGTNSGDQTITLTGDVTGTGTGSFVTTLATVNANVGAFGSTTAVPIITVNAKGLITAVSTAALGTAAVENTGTSGHTLGFLDGTNTWANAQTFSANPVVSGGGVAFPATQVPSADANTLDDYEEGTFTPTLTFGGASVGMTFSNQTGRYTKIGRMVFVEIRFVLTAKGSSVGAAVVGALPFTSAASPTSQLSFGPNTMAAMTVPTASVTASSTNVALQDFVGSTNVNLTDANFNNNSVIRLSGCYTV